jgi:Ankyrin repeat
MHCAHKLIRSAILQECHPVCRFCVCSVQIYKVANELTTTGDEVAAALQTCAENGVARDHGDHSATGKAAWVANLDLYQCPLDVETYEGWTPLCRAALIGDPILAKLLLKKGCNPNKTTRLKHTALTYASYCCRSRCVFLLPFPACADCSQLGMLLQHLGSCPGAFGNGS